MARAKNMDAPAIAVNDAAIDAAQQQSTELATLTHEQQQARTELAQLLVYDKPYVEAEVINEARYHLDTAQHSMLEFGKILLIIRANTKGDFAALIEKNFAISARSAQRMMLVARRVYSDPQIERHATALSHLGKKKVLDLLTLPDESVADILQNDDPNQGLTLSEIERMTTREFEQTVNTLKAESAELQASADAKDKVISARDKKLAELEQKQNRSVSPDETEQALRADVSSAAHAAEVALRGDLTNTMRALVDHVNVHETCTPDALAKLLHNTFDQIAAAMQAVKTEFADEMEMYDNETWDNT